MRQRPGMSSFPSGRLVTVVLLVSLALWATMVFGTLARLADLATGIPPFDVRPRGYTVAEARELLVALGVSGRDYYLDAQLRLDTTYPFTYAISRGLLLWWLTAGARLRRAPIPVGLRCLVIGLPLIAMSFDYAENVSITAMLRSGPDAGLIAMSGVATQVKSLASLVTETSVVVLGAVVAVRA